VSCYGHNNSGEKVMRLSDPGICMNGWFYYKSAYGMYVALGSDGKGIPCSMEEVVK